MTNIASSELIEELVPEDQQEDEGDLGQGKQISFKDAVVMNADWTIETINSQANKGNIDLEPGFQRRAAWDDTRKSRLVESIIVGMPVPNIVLAENKSHRGKFIVIDGKQRLLAINDFMADKFILRGLDIRTDLNGKIYSTLPDDDHSSFDNSTLRSTVIKNWEDDDFLYTIFFRLNSGSLQLSPQELRKALIGGRLLEFIENYLQGSEAFKLIFGPSLDRRMRDSELVLRFVAFDRSFEEYKGNLKEFLDSETRFYESNWDQESANLEARLKRLDSALIATSEIFGKNAFKKWLGDGYERRINRAIFDCITRFFSDPNVATLSKSKSADVLAQYKSICLEVDFKDAIEKTTKSVTATKHRIEKWGIALGQTIGLIYQPQSARLK